MNAVPERARSRRELVLALLMCGAGAGLSLLAASRGWVTVAVSEGSPLPPVTESGRGVAPLVPALAVVGLAGVVGLLATRRIGRLVLGVVLAAAGLALVLRALPNLAAPSPARAAELLDEHGRSVGVRAGESAHAEVHPVWPLLAALGGLAVCAGGVLTVLRSRRWPGMSSRYDAPVPAGAPGRARGAAAAERADPDAANRRLWDAMDRGEDPTTESRAG